jgi:hypothetical protein
MVMAQALIGEDYWENFALQDADTEFLYNYLLELETPLTTQELAAALIKERIRREKAAIESQRTSGGDLYMPKNTYQVDQMLVFPAFNWRRGKVKAVRPGKNPALDAFQVLQVAFDDGSLRDFAGGVAEHALNDPPKVAVDDLDLDDVAVLETYGEIINEALETDLATNPEFVRIAARWFPRALLVDINMGHLNLAEAVLEMANGGPLPTRALIEQLDIPVSENPRLVEFSLDLALDEDPRFDEVGPSGEVLWFLNRLEPPQVLEPPIYLRYPGIEYDRSRLTPEMLNLERQLDDELSPITPKGTGGEEVEIRLTFPHWRAGTLPLSAKARAIFPTAFESPRIQFRLVDGDTGERFSAWVVREKRYIVGVKEWFIRKNLIPGSLVKIRRGDKNGEVILSTESRRPTREWIKTVLVGSDGGVVFAMLKQSVHSMYDERMTIAIPDAEALDQVWLRPAREQMAFERAVITMVRELAKLNPQSHVHASELYAAINVVRRCPPGPLLALLISNPSFRHVGDLHFRYNEAD